MPLLTVNATRLYYETHGSGVPLLLIHGLGLDSGAWLHQVAAFAASHQVIVFDNRGIGRSETPAADYSIATMAEDAIALMNALQIERAHIVGFSMGGLIAQVLALHYPERVQRLILASTAAQLPATTQLVIQGWSQLLTEKIRPATRLHLQLPWLFTDRFLHDTAQVNALVNDSLSYPYPPTAQGIAGQVSACVAFTALPLRQMTTPALVLVGQDDRLTPVALSQELASRIPGAALQIIEGGHNIFWEMPEQFNQAVLNFCSPSATSVASSNF